MSSPEEPLAARCEYCEGLIDPETDDCVNRCGARVDAGRCPYCGWMVDLETDDCLNQCSAEIDDLRAEERAAAELQCSHCGSKELLPVFYGYPSKEALKFVEQGLAVLGGCIVFDDMPDKKCWHCGWWFRSWDRSSEPPFEE